MQSPSSKTVIRSAQESQTLWENPPAAYRGKPFWSWNGKLEIPELMRQVEVLKTMGMGGFFMHSRTGLITEYLGEEWFEAINAVAEEGERQGLEAWIYDEDRWPSGSAGGLATEEEAFRMKVLRCRVLEEGPIEWPEESGFLAAYVADLNGLRLGAYERLAYGSQTTFPGRHVLLFSWELLPSRSFYNGNTYLDTLDRSAVENFLRITHDRYAEACGDRLGKSIPGIFTDEPHRGLVMPTEPWGIGPAEGQLTGPWTPKLPEAYRSAFGSDLIDVLPEVFFQKDGERLSPHKWRYMELLQQLFLNNWAEPCLQRSHAHGLQLTGHVFHEDNLMAQALPQGSLARYYAYMDVPGIDVLASDNQCFWIAKQVQSVARQLDKPWILSELYGCSGWRMTFADHKRMGDWQTLFGVNVRCHHLSWYSMAGEAKRDYPASIFFQSAWWREYADVETYFARLHTVLQSGRPVCEVLVLNPIESFWAQIHPGWSDWLQPGSPELKALQTQYEELFQWLQGNRIDFDYGDEDHIAHMARVVKEGGEVCLELGAMRYRSVVVAGCETLRSSTLAVLEAFHAAGGQVIFAGGQPRYVDAVRSERVAQLAAVATETAWKEDAVVAALSNHPDGSLFSLHGAGTCVFAQVRELEDGWVLVLLNTSDSEGFESVAIEFKGGKSVEQWDALSGDRWGVAAFQTEDVLRWQTQLPALAERVFRIRSEGKGTVAPQAALPSFGSPVQLPGPFAYEMGDPNLLVLDYARVRVDGAEWSEPMEVLKIEEYLCSRTDVPVRGGMMVQPWAQKKTATSPPGLPVELQFEFEVNELPADPLRLGMERIAGQSLQVNGKSCGEAGSTDEWMIDPCLKTFQLEPSSLKQGLNTITLRFEFESGVALEALYLTGSFAVRVRPGGVPSQVDALPATLGLGDLCPQGFPFYSDRMVYRIPVDQPGRLQVRASGAACVAFQAAGNREVIPWGEFTYTVTAADVEQGVVRCELILTRRNTFGPLHHTNLDMTWVAPGCFRSAGEDWTDDYMLLPCGLDSVHFEALV